MHVKELRDTKKTIQYKDKTKMAINQLILLIQSRIKHMLNHESVTRATMILLWANCQPAQNHCTHNYMSLFFVERSF